MRSHLRVTSFLTGHVTCSGTPEIRPCQGWYLGVADKLETYRARRDPGRTSEPIPGEGPLPQGKDDTFVIQEHHARSLH
jgi:hypothetical protein